MNFLVVGLGLRISTLIREFARWDPGFCIAAVVDPAREAVLERLAGVYDGKEPRFFDALPQALDAGPYDGVIVGTRCDLHAGIAVEVMRRNLPMFLEKPVATTTGQLEALAEANRRYRAQAVCSFPLRVSPLVALAGEIVGSGRLGTVEHVQAFNNVPYAGVYYHDWYRDDGVTGGLWLQKATHDFDYINHLLGQAPLTLCAMDSKQVFKGDRPDGLTCEACGENRTCPESPFVLQNRSYERVTGPYCCFARDTGNQDSGSAIIRYASGMHAVYTQNFIARKKAAYRGARLVGYRGTLEFDWYTGELAVYSHTTPVVERHTFDTAALGHFGGDRVLAENFIDVCRGGESGSPLGAGLLSAAMCLAAERSSREGVFVPVPAFG